MSDLKDRNTRAFELLYGVQCDPDWKAAFQLWEQSAKDSKETPQARDKSLKNLFTCYRFGLGVKKSRFMAEKMLNNISDVQLRQYLTQKLAFDPEDCAFPPKRTLLKKSQEFDSLGPRFPEVYYYIFRSQEEYAKLYDRKMKPDWQLIEKGAKLKDPQCMYRLISEKFPQDVEAVTQMTQLAKETGNTMAAWELAAYYKAKNQPLQSKEWKHFALDRLWPTEHDRLLRTVVI